MGFHLPEHVRAKVCAMRQAEANARAAFATLSNSDLAAAAQFWMQHCEQPKRIEPDTAVYDSTLWHAIIPEMIARLQT